MTTDKMFTATGLNSVFSAGHGDFSSYVQQTRAMLYNAQSNVHNVATDIKVEENSPFEWWPEQPAASVKKGVLLIHGLYDSPYTLRDLGRYFQSQGFLVRAILLPGHGTVPGDLLHVTWQEWYKAVAYGVQSLQQTVENVYITGFSLGGALALYYALQTNKLKALILLAPALKSTSHLTFLLRAYPWWRRYFNSLQWYGKHPQQSRVKYESFTMNAAYQITALMHEIHALLARQKLQMPVFIVTSDEDGIVRSRNVVDLLIQQTDPRSRLLLYSRHKRHFNDPRIEVRNSAFPEQNIINFSHTCLPIAPDNPHYGRAGDYKDFLHYNGNKMPAVKKIIQGSLLVRDDKKFILQRLSYNPDFSGMTSRMGAFLDSVE